ncbi:OsmC family protein [Caulobacter sp. 17J65-9]|uniref:OsmC family protein n=1 Tax=Caulobacter sp. 17J65-9 TaxID=2709382 RepID=UPI0013C9DBED|nr:OsmC family protein [Caulobacter sp. 17J65-9]NEX93017.1 OsmC family peroxiredoxin [Caulobacter sp. 17J65-9]
MSRTHRYAVTVEWTGDRGAGTSRYDAYDRDHQIAVAGKPAIPGSSDPAFRGDPGRWNPEELLVGAVSACHKLWYLHLCAVNGVTVTAYVDRAEGEMVEDADGGGRFEAFVLRPEVTIRAGDPAVAEGLHAQAHEKCFIANSLTAPVRVEPVVRVEAG